MSSLSTYFGESYHLDDNGNLTIYSTGEEDCKRKQKIFDTYKKTGTGRCFSDHESKMKLTKDGYVLVCNGNIQLDKLKENISWTIPDFIWIIFVSIIIFALLIMIFK